MTNDSIKNKIEKAIKNVRTKFIEHPGIFLSESDVKCHFFNELYKSTKFSKLKDTHDGGKKSIDLHTEIRWYGRQKNLDLKSDIVILDSKDLRTTNSEGLKLPSKGYSFNKFYALIELKLRRNARKSDQRILKDIQNDIQKIETVKREVLDDFLAYIVIFDKKNNIENLVNELATNDIKITYAYNS